MSSTQTAPTPFQPPNQAGSAAAFQQGAGSLAAGGQQIQNTALPGYQTLLNNLTNNPYYSTAQGTAGQVATQGAAAGNSQISQGGQLQTLGNQAASYIPGTLATGYDPQNALYNRTQTQLTNQNNAINAANGVAGSPFGAGLTTQANENFNIDWQNNEQQRQLAALSGAQGLATADQGLQTAGAGLQDQGLQTLTNSGMLPYLTYLQNQQAIGTGLNSLVQGDNQAYGLTQEATADQGSYLNIGQTASQGAINAAQANNQASAAQMAGFGSLFGDVLGMFTFGAGGGGGSSASAFLGG